MTLFLFFILLTFLNISAFKYGASSGFRKKYPTAAYDVSAQILEDKLDVSGFKLGTVLDIFSSSTETPKSDGDFVVPSTRAWLSSVAIQEPAVPNPPTIVAPPTYVAPPDALTFFRTRVLDPYHESKVMELVDKTTSLTYFNAEETADVMQAMRVAYCAFYGKQTQRSLEMLINRARGTAAVLGELKADSAVVLAGILHDVLAELPRGEFAFEMRSNLVSMFGFDAVNLAESYGRLPKFMARKTVYTPAVSENQVQMLVALSEDYRGLYIRLADRLHVLRVLRSLPLDDAVKVKIATEALHVYAPLAHKMNVMAIKGELEDLAFRVLNPALFLESKRTQWLAHKALHDGQTQIQQMLASDELLSAQAVTFKLPFRIKDKYQLALKMNRKGLSSVTEVRDAVGMRVILDVPRLEGESDEAFSARGEAACYHVVSRIRAMSGWAPSTGGFKDYILAKKGNGYSSLHQYMHNQALDTHLEVQVRTRDMHVQAELGEAAHWNYKDTLYRPEIANSKYYKIAWRSKEQAHARSAAELIGLAKKQLNAQRVFVFLNDESTVLNLRKGATALDAAFAIHTSIGLSVKGIKVSGTPVGLKRVMQNGDVISVECEASAVTAEPSWLGYTKLAYSRTNIRRYLRQKHADTILQYTISKQTATPVFAVASNQHVCEPAVVEEEAPSRPFTFHKFSPTLLRVQPRALARSATSKAQKPFSLEAASLTLPLQRLARQHVAASIMRSQLA